MRHVLLAELVGALKQLGFEDVSSRPAPALPYLAVVDGLRRPVFTPRAIGHSGEVPPAPTVRLKTETFVCPVVIKYHPGWVQLSVDLATVVFPCFEIDKPLVVWDVLEAVKDDNIRATIYTGGERRVVEGKGKSYQVHVAGVRVGQ